MEVADAAAVAEAVAESRERLIPWMPWAAGAHQSIEDSIDFCARSRAHWLLRDDDMNMGIFERRTGRYLGGIGIHAIEWRVPRCEIGYWIRDGAEGQGYVSEAMQLVTRLCFDTLGAKRVEIRCDSRNVRSRRVAERNGYVLEATLRDHDLAPDGSLRDTLVFAMTRADFAAAAPSWRA